MFYIFFDNLVSLQSFFLPLNYIYLIQVCLQENFILR